MDFPRTERNNVKRVPDRGIYDKENIYTIVDEALICFVGFSIENQPFVIPTIHARKNDTIYLHGATTSRMIKHLEAGNRLCLTVTQLDGLVLARSVFHHSMNYRSAMLYGSGRQADEKEKLLALEIITEKLIPGRWKDARTPNEKELKATSIIAIDIEEASAKIRTGGPTDDEDDYNLKVWAGVIPICQNINKPVDDKLLQPGIDFPDYLKKFYEK